MIALADGEWQPVGAWQRTAEEAVQHQERLRRRLRELREIAAELDTLTEGSSQAERLGEVRQRPALQIDEVCNLAARIRTAAPVLTTLGSNGWPVAPMPPGCWLPFPTVQEELAQASLRAAAGRAPPPEVSASPHPNSQHGAGWEVRLQPLPPAVDVLYTTDGSLPHPNNKAARVLKGTTSADRPISVASGMSVLAIAVRPGLQVSDTVAFRAPQRAFDGSTPKVDSRPALGNLPPQSAQTRARPPHSVQQGATALTARTQFRGSLLLGADSDDDESAQ